MPADAVASRISGARLVAIVCAAQAFLVVAVLMAGALAVFLVIRPRELLGDRGG